jgi:hypothetical protein
MAKAYGPASMPVLPAVSASFPIQSIQSGFLVNSQYIGICMIPPLKRILARSIPEGPSPKLIQPAPSPIPASVNAIK